MKPHTVDIGPVKGHGKIMSEDNGKKTRPMVIALTGVDSEIMTLDTNPHSSTVAQRNHQGQILILRERTHIQLASHKVWVPRKSDTLGHTHTGGIAQTVGATKE